jgi:hypothetical protein
MIAATQTAVLNITTMKGELWSTAVVPRQMGNDAQRQNGRMRQARKASARPKPGLLIED